jgi:hypothetical protein
MPFLGSFQIPGWFDGYSIPGSVLKFCWIWGTARRMLVAYGPQAIERMEIFS